MVATPGSLDGRSALRTPCRAGYLAGITMRGDYMWRRCLCRCPSPRSAPIQCPSMAPSFLSPTSSSFTRRYRRRREKAARCRSHLTVLGVKSPNLLYGVLWLAVCRQWGRVFQEPDKERYDLECWSAPLLWAQLADGSQIFSGSARCRLCRRLRQTVHRFPHLYTHHLLQHRRD